MIELDRRRFLAATAPFAFALAGLDPACAAVDQANTTTGPQSFDFDRLRARAKALAAKPYVEEKPPAADIVSKIDFDAVQKIRFRAEKAIWRNGPGPFPVRLFPLDKIQSAAGADQCRH